MFAMSPARRALPRLGTTCAVLMFAAAMPALAQERELPGAALQILDDEGAVVGGCPLERTEVTARLVGYFARTTVTQVYTNPLPTPIEAVYVFPLPHTASVDSMVMTIGDRRIIGQVRERAAAREIYEQARDAGQVASLLDEERPNIFTQSVANIAPGATVEIEISFVETVKYSDGAFHWNFPMVVGPRYIPGGGSAQKPMETGQNTPQVPDGSKITPPIVPEGMRAGHTISLDVLIDPGIGLQAIESTSHEIEAVALEDTGSSPWRVSLAQRDTIPNKDFTLKYTPVSGGIGDAFFVHEDERGKFFALMLMPPTRPITPADVQPRELIFVLDTSGSMNGFPIEHAKKLMRKLIDGMQPQDRFNVITFAGTTRVLWETPQPATAANIAAAQQLVGAQRGGGGTEMMTAINTALHKSELSVFEALQLAEDAPAISEAARTALHHHRVVGRLERLPAPLADGATHILEGPHGRARVQVVAGELGQEPPTGWVSASGHITQLPATDGRAGQRRAALIASKIESVERPDVDRLRVVCFLTDGYVGNDLAILDAIKKNAGSTRVFSFGIGNSVNRFLIEKMAEFGRGVAEVVMLAESAAQAGARLHDRLAAPVMKDVGIELIGGQVGRVYPRELPDLYSVEPVMIVGRLAGAAPSRIRLTGITPDGLFDRSFVLSFPDQPTDRKALASLWARRAVDAILEQHYDAVQQDTLADAIKQQVVDLGTKYGIVSRYTSFVAVDERITNLDGELVKVEVPVEMPDGVSYDGIFGSNADMWLGATATRMPARGGGRAGRRGQSIFGSPSAPPPPAPPGEVAANRLATAEEAAADAEGQHAEHEPKSAAQPRADLAPELRKLIEAREQDNDADLAALARAAGLRVSDDGQRIYLALKLGEDTRDVRAALAKLGFEPLPSAVDGLVLGTLPLEQLEQLTTVAGVNKVGPLRAARP